MSHVAHDLNSEFPDDLEALQELKLNDRHFQQIAERHHEVNREIHRIEAGVEAASDERLEDLKKTRLALLDEVAGMISRKKRQTAQA